MCGALGLLEKACLLRRAAIKRQILLSQKSDGLFLEAGLFF
jgi:hypothetical protein